MNLASYKDSELFHETLTPLEKSNFRLIDKMNANLKKLQNYSLTIVFFAGMVMFATTFFAFEPPDNHYVSRDTVAVPAGFKVAIRLNGGIFAGGETLFEARLDKPIIWKEQVLAEEDSPVLGAALVRSEESPEGTQVRKIHLWLEKIQAENYTVPVATHPLILDFPESGFGPDTKLMFQLSQPARFPKPAEKLLHTGLGLPDFTQINLP